MTALLYVAVVLFSASQSTLNKLNRGGDAIRFNFFKGLSSSLLFVLAFLVSGEGFHLPTMLYGLVYGVLLAVANQAGYRAIHAGPMALTSMLVNFSLIIPFAVGVICWNERPSVFTYVGFALLIAALVCLNFRKANEDASKRPSLKWLFYVLCTLVANGGCSVITTMHQRAYPGEYEFGFTAWCVLLCFLIFTALSLAGGKLKTEYRLPRCDLYASAAGIANVLASFFTVMLAARTPASILYPLLAAVTMLAALLIGRFLFREKLTRRQLAGFALGVLSVVLFKL